MKKIIFLSLIVAAPFFMAAQTHPRSFGTCFSKANQKSIDNKMENLITRVSQEASCPKEKVTYTVTEYYTVFYSKECRHLPKKIQFDCGGVKKTYKHNGLSGAILYWLLGSWTLEKENTQS